MADKEPVIVIKKINVVAGGSHGGSWKVAFADFMTAMMAFFLVMWLIGQSDEVKENVADYFSTPSIIEYNFSNYGAELTLEKLFLDLMNEPLKAFQSFIKPIDKTPNIMGMGSKKIVLHHLADQLGDLAQSVNVNENEVSFEVPEYLLFLPGTYTPSSQFVNIMEKVTGITQGLEDANVYIDSETYFKDKKDESIKRARNLAEARLDLIVKKIDVGLEHETVDIYGKPKPIEFIPTADPHNKPVGKIKFKFKQKEFLSDGRKPRKLDDMFSKKEEDMNVYDNFVNQMTKKKKSKK